MSSCSAASLMTLASLPLLVPSTYQDVQPLQRVELPRAGEVTSLSSVALDSTGAALMRIFTCRGSAVRMEPLQKGLGSAGSSMSCGKALHRPRPVHACALSP